ncbi:MAG: hypothetical protein V3V20_08430 [Algisphaera sp.]
MHDDDLDDGLDPEGPSEADLVATQCRGCGVYVDADEVRCSRCGDWMADEVPQRSSPLWVVMVALLMVLGVLVGWII